MWVRVFLATGGAAVTAGLVWYLLHKAGDAGAKSSSRKKGRAPEHLFKVTDPKGSTIGIREAPDVHARRTGRLLLAGEMFAVDQVIGAEGGQRYLRLSDGRGWAITHSTRDGRLLVQPASAEEARAWARGGDARPKAAAAVQVRDHSKVHADSRQVDSRQSKGEHGKAAIMDLLAAVAHHPCLGTLRAVQAFISTDRHAAVNCRHSGGLAILSDAWRRCPGDPEVASLVASMLLAYAGLHGKTLRKLGVDALCTTAMTTFGASREQAPVAKLWCRVSCPAPKVALDLIMQDNADTETLKPLMRHLASQKGLEDLQRAEVRTRLEVLVFGDAGYEAMLLLCRAAEPIQAPYCSRGTGGGADSDESDSDDGSGADGEVAVQSAPRFHAKPDRSQSALGAIGGVHAADQRAANVARLLNTHGCEAIPPGSTSAEIMECSCIAPSPPCKEFLDHLAVEAAAAAEWPVAFPGPGLNGLRFDVDFDGGNLCRVRMDAGGAAEVLLSRDTNRNGHCHWFFFEVRTAEPLDLRIHVVNLTKVSSTYLEGQRIVVLGPEDSGWRRGGRDYACFPNRYCFGTARRHHTLAFTVPLAAGCTRIAPFYPYLMGDLLSDLRRLRPVGDWLDVRDIGPTPGGRQLLVLTITDFGSLESGQLDATALPFALRPRVVLSARVHPGETPASFVLRGALELLLSDGEEARELRGRFAFVVLPLLNPDGVALGNGRSNSLGHDLNRCWEQPPEGSEAVAARRELEALCAAPGGVVALLDLHAHSSRHGAFTLSNPGTSALPDLVAQSGSPLFDRRQCVFSCTRTKRGSARCVAWRELGVAHAHTVEATYAALPGRERLVTPPDLSDLGRCLVRACAKLAAPTSECGTQPTSKCAQTQCRPARS